MDAFDHAAMLESYIIPAEEGLIFSDVRIEKAEKLGEKFPLIVFTTDENLKYGGVNVNKLVRDYHFSGVECFNFEKWFLARIDENPSGFLKSNTISNMLYDLLISEKVIEITENSTIGGIFNKLVLTCQKYSETSNHLVLVLITQPLRYCYSCMRDYPIEVINTSMAKSIFNMIGKNDTMTVKDLRQRIKDFSQVSNRVPKNILQKNFKNDLYHISPNPNITKLEPRITNKPMETENLGIPRISAACSVDACFRAIGIKAVQRAKNQQIKYYVYKLKLTDKIRVAKPTKELVPDVLKTGEYWVLDPVPVDCIGTITVTYNPKTNNYDFDTSNMPMAK